MSRPARFAAVGDVVQVFRHSVARGKGGWPATLVAGALLASLSPLSAQQGEEAFDPRDFSGNWDRETAIVTFSNVPGSFRELPAFEDTWPTWNGFSVGHFEGDTLVVETIGFDARTWLDKYGHPHSEEMRLEERYRRLDADTLELTMTIRDPVMYSEPWNSDTKIYSLNRDRLHEWDEQIYCVPAEEFSLQELFGTGNTID